MFKRTITCMMFFGLVLTLFSGEAEQISTDMLRLKCAKAMTGSEDIQVLTSLRFSIVYPGHDYTVITEYARPNKFMNTGKNSSAICDGKKACIRKMTEGGTKVKVIMKEEMPDFVAEPGLFFPYYFDYPFENEGVVVTDGKESYKLVVNMPFDVVMDYYVDSGTFLLLKTVAHVKVNGKNMKWKREYLDYTTVKGITYSRAFNYYYNDSEEKNRAEIIKAEFNIEFPESYFNISEKPE